MRFEWPLSAKLGHSKAVGDLPEAAFADDYASNRAPASTIMHSCPAVLVPWRRVSLDGEP